MRDYLVIVGNFGQRYSGINSTLESVVDALMPSYPVAIAGGPPSRDLPHLKWRNAWRLWRPPAGLGFRIWHARRNTDMLVGLVLRDILRMPVRLVFTSAAQRKHSLYTTLLINRMDALIATSPAAAGYLKRPAAVIPHGVDTKRFRPSQDKARLRADFGLDDGLLIGCFGRIRPSKGTDLLIDAMIPIMQRHGQVRLVLSGLTKSKHRKFAGDLRMRMQRAGLARRLHWLGELPAERIPALYRCMDLFVAPPRREGFGVTPLEAMASGIPVVASRAGAFESQIVHGETGLLTPVNDALALEQAIWRLIDDPQKRALMGVQARAHVEQSFAVKREAEAISRLFSMLWDSAEMRWSGRGNFVAGDS